MFFKIDDLFISPAGIVTTYTENGDRYKKIEPDGFIIVKKSNYSSEGYFDAFSKTSYMNFSDSLCSGGVLAVSKPTKLTLFISKEFEVLNKSKILFKIINKISHKKYISRSDIKTLLFYLNNTKQLEIDEQKLNINKKSTLNIKIYTNLYKKKYKLQPCFERNKELSELICALPEKNTTPILVGEHGSGRTTIIDGLMYRIQKKVVPDFLWKQKIIELDIANLIASENQEQKLIDLISYCIKNNIILFIDDIEKLIEYELYEIVKESVKRKNLKTISSTTIDNYNKYFLNDDFTKISIDEPSNEELDKIIRGVIDNYSKETKIIYNKEDLNIVIYTLTDITNIKNRNINTNNKDEDDKSCNPYLVIKIIDKMFSHAIANEQKELSLDNLIYAINSCDKINNNIKESYENKIIQKTL